MTIGAIVETSKISLRYLEALEADRFDVLPAPVFVRGFLREYSRIVGLDPDEVINFYLLAQPARSTERSAESRAAAPRSGREPAQRVALVGYGLLVAALLAVFVGVAATISWWASRRAEPAPAPSSSAPATAPTTAERPAEPAVEAWSPPDSESLALAPAPAVEAAPAGVAERLRVVLEFQQDCWVEVVLDGRRRASELKAGGETLALEAEEYVALTLGNAPAVRVEVNGRPYPLALQGSRVVRDLRIDRAAVTKPAAARDESPGQ